MIPTQRTIPPAALGAGLAAVTIYWMLVIQLTPYEIAAFCDGHGYQLAGGAEILAGRHPFLDFKESYGPLVFYLSAFAQWISAGGLWGELTIIGAACAGSFALLFRLMLGIGVPARIAAPTTALAILTMPVPYRYYLLLPSLLFLGAAWRYTDRPTWGRLAVLAFTITVAGLFRPDYGIYTLVAGLVLTAVHAHAVGGRIGWRLVGLSGLVLLWAIPWLGWLAGHGKLGEYLVLSSFDAIQKAVEYSVPAPTFGLSDGLFSENNLKLWLFRCPLIIVALGGWVFVRRAGGWPAAYRARVAGALTFAAISLLQVSHRVDWFHVRDVLPAGFLVLAWVMAHARDFRSASVGGRVAAWTALGLAAGLSLGLAAGAVRKEWRNDFSPRAVRRKVTSFRGDYESVLERMRREPDPYHVMEVIDYVRQHSPDTASIFVVVDGPQLNYFCHRTLAGDQFAILPGYFSTDASQQELIEKIRGRGIAFVVVKSYGMEERPDLPLAKYAPRFAAFLRHDFKIVAQPGHFRILAPRMVGELPRPEADTDEPGTRR